MFDPKKLGEEADEMIRNLNQQAPAEAEVPAEQPVEEQVEDTQDAIAQSEVVEDDQGTEDSTVVSDTAAPESTDSQAIDELKKQIDAAEQKWRVLQGMINKKDQELDAMRELFAQVSVPQESSETKPAPEPVQNKLTEKDIDEYGADLIDMVRRASHDEMQQQMQAMLDLVDKRLKQVEGSVQTVEQTTARTAQGAFFDSLSKQVPDWEQLNVDESFLGWLEQPEPFTGAQRLQLLQDAVAQKDVARAAAFFNTYKQQYGVQPEVVADDEEPAPRNSAKLAAKVAPGKSRAPAQKPMTDKIQWDRKAIAKLYDDKRLGRITAKEFDRLERDLFTAQTEGRVAV